jgi:hypothetical protein
MAIYSLAVSAILGLTPEPYLVLKTALNTLIKSITIETRKYNAQIIINVN